MVQKYVVQLVDDLSNEPIEAGEGETIAFALDGVNYAIDLSTDHAAELRRAFDRYVAAARKGEPTKGRAAGPKTTAKSDLATVREWANSHGFTVSTRGRIPNEVQQAFDRAR